MLAVAENKHRFTWLEPTPSRGDITAADVVHATDAAAHRRLVTGWALGAWSAGSRHHDTIRAWLPVRWFG